MAAKIEEMKKNFYEMFDKKVEKDIIDMVLLTYRYNENDAYECILTIAEDGTEQHPCHKQIPDDIQSNSIGKSDTNTLEGEETMIISSQENGVQADHAESPSKYNDKNEMNLLDQLCKSTVPMSHINPAPLSDPAIIKASPSSVPVDSLFASYYVRPTSSNNGTEPPVAKSHNELFSTNPYLNAAYSFPPTNQKPIAKYSDISAKPAAIVFNQPAVTKCSMEKGMKSDLERFKDYINEPSRHIMILMRGLPGSGKSFKARLLNGYKGVIYSADEYFMQNGRYNFKPEVLSEAHLWNQNRARMAIDHGISPVFIDNTNLETWEMKPYVFMAKKKKYEIRLVPPDTPWAWKPSELARRNTHGIPKSKIELMMERYEKNVSIESILNSNKPAHKVATDVPSGVSSFQRMETNIHTTYPCISSIRGDHMVVAKGGVVCSNSDKARTREDMEPSTTISNNSYKYFEPNHVDSNSIKPRNLFGGVQTGSGGSSPQINNDENKVGRIVGDTEVNKVIDITQDETSNSSINEEKQLRENETSSDGLLGEKQSFESSQEDLHGCMMKVNLRNNEEMGSGDQDLDAAIKLSLSQCDESRSGDTSVLKSSYQCVGSRSREIDAFGLRLSPHGCKGSESGEIGASAPKLSSPQRKKSGSGEKDTSALLLSSSPYEGIRPEDKHSDILPQLSSPQCDITDPMDINQSMGSSSTLSYNSEINATASKINTHYESNVFNVEDNDICDCIKEMNCGDQMGSTTADHYEKYKTKDNRLSLEKTSVGRIGNITDCYKSWSHKNIKNKKDQGPPAAAASCHIDRIDLTNDTPSYQYHQSEYEQEQFLFNLQFLYECFPDLRKSYCKDWLKRYNGDLIKTCDFLSRLSQVDELPDIEEFENIEHSLLEIKETANDVCVNDIFGSEDEDAAGNSDGGKVSLVESADILSHNSEHQVAADVLHDKDRRDGKILTPLNETRDEGKQLHSKSEIEIMEINNSNTTENECTMAEVSRKAMGELFFCDSDDAISSDRMSVTIDAKLGFELFQLFGSSEDINDELSSEDYTIPLTKDMAKQIYHSWIGSIKDRKRKVQRMLEDDERFAKQLQNEEQLNLESPNGKRKKAKKSKGKNRKIDTHFSNNQPARIAGGSFDPGSHWKDEDSSKWILSESGKDILSPRQLKLQMELHNLFPGVDEDSLNNILEVSSFNIDAAVSIIRTSCHLVDDEVKNVYAAEDDTNWTKVSSPPKRKIMSKSFVADALKSLVSWSSGSSNIEAAPIYVREDDNDIYQTMTASNQSYQDFRAEAELHKNLRTECFQKAAKAFQEKNGLLAQHYADEARKHTLKMKDAHKRAAELTLSRANQQYMKDQKVIDFHGLHADEAVRALNNFLRKAHHKGHKKVYLITGRGAHSKNSFSTVRKAVIKVLNSKNYQYRMQSKGGMLEVFLK